MPNPTPPPGDQTADVPLTQADLPPGWYLPGRFPGERLDDASGEIDRVLGYDHQGTGQAESDQNDTSGGRWRYIAFTEKSKGWITCRVADRR